MLGEPNLFSSDLVDNNKSKTLLLYWTISCDLHLIKDITLNFIIIIEHSN